MLGFANIDNVGIAGIEKYIDAQGLQDLNGAGFAVQSADLTPVALSIDLRAQHALRDELAKALDKYKAKAAAGTIVDVNTGEVVALVSLPDFDPNNPVDALDKERINRINVGVYEMGSTFKAITTAMALNSGRFTINSTFDARAALRYGRFTINDFHAQHRVMSVPEVFIYSSNIGTARMALGIGVDGHKAFLRKMGQLDRLRTELPESAEPIIPPRWGELNTMTIAFGHGLAVAPLQARNGDRGAREWRVSHPADLPEAEPDGGARAGDAGHQARDQRGDALRHAPQCGARIGKPRRGGGLFRRRQDRHGREGRRRPLFKEQASHHLHGHRPLRQAALPVPHGPGRAAGPAGNARLRHLRPGTPRR